MLLLPVQEYQRHAAIDGLQDSTHSSSILQFCKISALISPNKESCPHNAPLSSEWQLPQ